MRRLDEGVAEDNITDKHHVTCRLPEIEDFLAICASRDLISAVLADRRTALIFIHLDKVNRGGHRRFLHTAQTYSEIHSIMAYPKNNLQSRTLREWG